MIIQKIKDFFRIGMMGMARSSQWTKVRTNYLKSHPICAVCGGDKKLECHHKIPFHYDISKELDPFNLITLCENKKNGVTCHLFFGHLGNYKSYNENVVEDAKNFNLKLKNRP